jgi:hypothetical protein
MNKALLFLLLILSATTTVFAQVYPEDFIIPLSGHIVHNSLYNTISFMDSRPTEKFMNRKPKNVTSLPLDYQLTNLMDRITDSSAANDSLLLQLRLFNFAEVTGNISQKGSCYLRAVLYSKKGDHYLKINSLDTSAAVQVSPNLSRGALAMGGKILAGFIANSLVQTPADSTLYSLNDIKKTDSIEKQQMKLYTATAYVDGVYISYGSFKNQVPDKQIITADTTDNGNLFAVKIIDKGEKTRVQPKDAYAAVYKGIPYIATKYGYYPLKKENGNFFFTGDIEVKSDVGDAVANEVSYGIVGAIASLGEEEKYDMELDHINGQFIRIQRIDTDLVQ